MPELPEVETTRRGLSPWLLGRHVVEVRVRQPRLRWPVPPELAERLRGARIERVERRAKYLLLGTEVGTAIVHLGMSGSLRVVEPGSAPRTHDHVELVLEDGRCVRFHDPRRFGAWLWTEGPPERHPLLADLGPEPLGEAFDADYLHACARGRRVSIKALLMDARVVVGVGNIYANEALFLAGIHPARAAGRVAHARCARLVETIREVLAEAIRAGGTTLRDFVASDGRPGYFAQSLRVYQRQGQPCRYCGTPLRQRVIAQRSSFYCPSCQR